MNSEKVNKFLKYLIEKEKSENTIEKYGRDIKQFFEYMNNKKIMQTTKLKEELYKEKRISPVLKVEKQIIKESIMSYKNFLKEKYNKVSTINSKLASLNAFLEWDKKEEMKVKIIKCQKQLFGLKEKELTKSDIHKLFKSCDKNERSKCIIATIAYTGIRVSEVKYITVAALKSGKAEDDNKGKYRIVLLPKKLCKILFQYCKKRNIKTGSVFISRNGKALDRKYIWKILKDLSIVSGVDAQKLFPHNLRHYFAREFYKQAKDIVKLSSLLGHSSINTTIIYSKQTEEECREEIEKIDLMSGLEFNLEDDCVTDLVIY